MATDRPVGIALPIVAVAMSLLLLQNILSNASHSNQIASLSHEIQQLRHRNYGQGESIKDKVVDIVKSSLQSKLNRDTAMHSVLNTKLELLGRDYSLLEAYINNNPTKQGRKNISRPYSKRIVDDSVFGNNSVSNKTLKLRRRQYLDSIIRGGVIPTQDSTSRPTTPSTSSSHNNTPHNNTKSPSKSKNKPRVNMSIPGNPWRESNGWLYIGNERTFKLDSNHNISFPPTIKRLQVHIGSGLHALPEAELHTYVRSDPGAVIVALDPYSTFLVNQRLFVIPARVDYREGYSLLPSNHTLYVPRIRLENLLKLVPSEVQIDLVKIYYPNDHGPLHSSGRFMNEVPRVIMQLKDTQQVHDRWDHPIANATLAIKRTKQRGFANLCCFCLDDTTSLLECYFAHRQYNNLSQWNPAFLAKSQCSQKPASDHVNQWNVPMCRLKPKQ